MTALEAMNIELKKTQREMMKYERDGYVIGGRYKYQALARRAKEINEGIEFLEELYAAPRC